MKRLIFFSIILLVLVGLAAGGNRIAGNALDAQLVPLLTRELGLPVQLAPLKANLLKLEATSAKLVMGDPANPAVTASDVVVRLDWSDLLQREIRLVFASASDLAVQVSRWPSSGNPLPEDYLFLDPWLPTQLEVESARYLEEDGDAYPLSQLRWERHSNGGARMAWSESRGEQVAIQANLKSLQSLLQLAPIEMTITAQAPDKADSAISVTTSVQPDKTAAYALQADIETAGLKGRIKSTGTQAWQLPDQSETSIEELLPDKLMALLKAYNRPGADEKSGSWLDDSLPQLDLPAHQGHVSIKEIRLGTEKGNDTLFHFEAGDKGLHVKELSSQGPTGILSGELGVTSATAGWVVKIDAVMQAREDDVGLRAQDLSSHWLWRTGKARLDGEGATWGALLYSLDGDVSVAGHYRDEGDTPVQIAAQLDNEPGIFALDHMAIKLGEGHFTGSASLSGEKQRKLTLDLTGERMELDFLFEEKDAKPEPGTAIPEYLAMLPEWALDWKLDVTGLNAPGLSLANASATLQRNEMGGKLVARVSGTEGGTLDLVLDASTPPGETGAFNLKADFTRLDLPSMFEQAALLHSRTSGTMTFRAPGSDIKDIFQVMQGRADLSIEVRSDDDWQRTVANEETLKIVGDSRFVISDNRIIGIRIENLDIDSIEQNLDGSFSMVAGQSPWLIADLTSKSLNINGLIELLPKSTEAADDADLLSSLRRLGAAEVKLNVDSLTIGDTPLSGMNLKMESGTNVLTIKQLDFTTLGSQFKSEGSITWQGGRATLKSSARLSSVDLDQFLIRNPDFEHIPISGTARLLSEGSKVAELLGNISGDIDLHASTPQQPGSLKTRRQLTMHARRIPEGVQADISTFEWGESELAGSVRFQNTSPPVLDVNLHGGTLSLLPWENAAKKPPKKETATKKNGGTISGVARTSADFIGNALLSPVRFFTGDEKKADTERLFSTEPLQLDSLKNLEMNITGQMDSLVSTVLTAKALTVTGKLKDGKLDLQAKVGELNGGNAEVDLSLDASAAPPGVKLTSHFENLRGLTNTETYTRSGFASFTSQGNSQAELAAGANGLVYLELGPGPFDYMNQRLLTADLASTMFRTLIPGIERRQPKLECGITVGLFKDGMGATPYGYAARTTQANLLGRIQLDLIKERLEMNVRSRSREGVGLSVGNVFSNTIQVRGPITNPRIVPNTTAIAWRSWAAFMTAGLSVVGESVLTRALASDNPCRSIKRIIAEELCKENPIAASSPMICPQGQGTGKSG